MSALITLRVQVNIVNPILFDKTVPEDSTVEDLKRIIRNHRNLDESDGVVLISNGKRLRNPNITLFDLGLCNESKIICIVSKETGREIEELFDHEEEAKYDNPKPILELEYLERPFGFCVWADEKGRNAIVTKVQEKGFQLGVEVGHCVYKVNDLMMTNRDHEYVLNALVTLPCPLRVSFFDVGSDTTVSFTKKPLGFTIRPCMDNRNAQIVSVTDEALRKNLKVGSYVAAVNNEKMFGMKYEEIIEFINSSRFPILIKFRLLPQLLEVSQKKRVGRVKRMFKSVFSR